MSEKRNLSAKERTTDFGSSGARRVLRGKRIPAVIYGNKKNSVHITLDAQEFTNKLRHFSETALLNIDVDGKKYECLMKDYQENLMRGEIKHVDFYEVTRGHVLRTKVSITLTGSAKGTREGGVFEQVLYEVEIECLPKDLPESITADVSKLGLHEVLHLRDLVFPAKVKVLDDLSQAVATVKTLKAEAVKAEVEAPVAVEVVAPAEKEDKAKK